MFVQDMYEKGSKQHFIANYGQFSQFRSTSTVVGAPTGPA